MWFSEHQERQERESQSQNITIARHKLVHDIEQMEHLGMCLLQCVSITAYFHDVVQVDLESFLPTL